MRHTFRQRGGCTSLLDGITLPLLTNSCVSCCDHRTGSASVKDARGKEIGLRMGRGSRGGVLDGATLSGHSRGTSAFPRKAL